MSAAALVIPPLPAGATFSEPKLARPSAPKELPLRDYGGYTDINIPTVTWPEGKKLALNIVLHFEEGAESTPENGDEYSEVLMGETERRPLRAGRDLAIEAVYEYGTKRGFWRLYDLLESLGFTFSLFACGRAAELTPEIVTKAQDLGAEVVASGYRFTNYDLVPEEVEAKHIDATLEILKELSPSKEYPKGFYLERPSISSSNLIKQAYEKVGAEWLYDAGVHGDDLPYYSGDGLLQIPHSLDCNDHKFVDGPGFSSPADFLEHLTNALEVLLKEGTAGKPKMMTLALHPRLIGRPGRFVALKRFLEIVKATDDIWVCQKQDVANHWKAHHPN
ncbi:hypothetical protein I317_06817 [Kwoniella heveanensis CBS 569]|nr:hypothetical protein I317_06817 [Kwoniella heveanensis CBS 569]